MPLLKSNPQYSLLPHPLFNLLDNVRILSLELDGFIDSISYSLSGFEYRVVYFNNGTRYQTWLYDREINYIFNELKNERSN